MGYFRKVENDIKIEDIENENDRGPVEEQIQTIEVIGEENLNDQAVSSNTCIVPEFVKPTKEFIDKAKLALKVFFLLIGYEYFQ